MRKVINGRTYNTETSKLIGSWDNGIYGSDFRRCEEDLYKNTKGAYFLVGEGGPMSKYSITHGNTTSGNAELIPMTATEAQEWAEEHLDADEYEAEFGVQEEAAPSDLTTRERVNLTLDSELMTRLRKHSVDTGVPMSKMVDKAITYILDKEQMLNKRTLEIIEETGRLPVSTIDDLEKFQNELKAAGYVSYLDASTDYLIVEKK